MDVYYRGNLHLDYSILNNIKPYESDAKEYFDKLNIDEEINKLSKEIESINIHSIPLDKYDYWVIFASAIAEIFADFMVCDPNQPGSLANKLNNTDNPLGKWCNSIHENLDHSGNPMDFQGRFDSEGNLIPAGQKHSGETISFGGGNHRERTYGHDLLRFFKAIQMYHDGCFIDAGIVNVNGSSKLIEVCSKVNQYGNPYEPMSYFEAICSYAIHMFADFFSAKGLPVPGWSWLSHADDRAIRKAAADAYNNGFNLRTLLLQGIPVAITEVIVRLYIWLRYRDSNYDKAAVNHKRDTLLLITHGLALAVNIGKVIITKNPFAVNIFMVLRVCKLVWNVVRDNLMITNRAIEKVNLSMLSLQFQTAKTLLLLDEAVYYTRNIKRLLESTKDDFDRTVTRRLDSANHSFDEMEEMMRRYRELNNT